MSITLGVKCCTMYICPDYFTHFCLLCTWANLFACHVYVLHDYFWHDS